jgi:hypothetical protein
MKTTYHLYSSAEHRANPGTRPQPKLPGEKWESDKKRNKTQQLM